MNILNKSLRAALAAVAALILVSCGGNNGVEDPARHGMDPTKLAQIDSAVNASLCEGNMPGAVVAVVRDQSQVYLKAFGSKSFVPDTVPMTVETMFDVASLSKCVGTTLSAMQLIEQGRLKLTDPVKEYIPGFEPWTDPETGETQDIIVRDLMTHSSGLSAYYDPGTFVSRFGANHPDSLVRVIATEVERHFRPGTGFLYSCLNFITMQNLVERLSGEKLNDYARKNIFEPMGLAHTCYFPLDEDLRTPLCNAELLPYVAPTTVQADGKPLLGAVHDPLARLANGGISGNAGVFSNAMDLSRICMMIMNHGSVGADRKHGYPNPSGQILAPETVDLMCTIPPENDPQVGRALGWDKQSAHSGIRGELFNPETTLCHTGYTGTSIVIDMETKTAVIILTNRVHPTDDGLVSPLRARIATIVAGAIKE